MSLELLLIVIAAVVAAAVGAVGAWIVWSVRTAVRQEVTRTVNGRISGVAGQVEDLDRKVDSLSDGQERMTRRFDRHDRRHEHDRRQLIAALSRQGVEPPDGWPPAEPS